MAFDRCTCCSALDDQSDVSLQQLRKVPEPTSEEDLLREAATEALRDKLTKEATLRGSREEPETERPKRTKNSILAFAVEEEGFDEAGKSISRTKFDSESEVKAFKSRSKSEDDFQLQARGSLNSSSSFWSQLSNVGSSLTGRTQTLDRQTSTMTSQTISGCDSASSIESPKSPSGTGFWAEGGFLSSMSKMSLIVNRSSVQDLGQRQSASSGDDVVSRGSSGQFALATKRTNDSMFVNGEFIPEEDELIISFLKAKDSAKPYEVSFPMQPLGFTINDTKSTTGVGALFGHGKVSFYVASLEKDGVAALLGVKENWILKRIGGIDLDGKDLDSVNELLQAEERKLPFQ
jgi:hypothetical protein